LTRTSKIIAAMSQEMAISIAIATGADNRELLRLRCSHNFVDILLDNIGKIGMLCTTCDQVSIYPEWIYNGEGVEPTPIPLRKRFSVKSRQWSF
jgi:hypothetical protein